ncbi:MAG: lipopolysaccharide biosynthesis protein [Chloroflexota bacterium]|nr:lipopolysaccharide biosynthesis protein [Chloroflexota bacterium]
MMILARLLTPDEFGLVAMATSIIGVAEIIRDFGLSSAAIQASELNDSERTNLFWVNLLIGAICGIAAAACSGLIANIYGQPLVATIVLSLSWLLLVSGANTQFRAELSRELRFRALAMTDVVAQVCSVGVAIAAAAMGAGYWSIVLQQIVLVVVTFVSNFVMCRWRPRWYRRDVSIRRFLRFGGGVVGTQAIGYAVNNVDNVAIGAVWGAAPLGVYGRAYQLLLVPLEQINAPMTNVVLPVLSRVRDDKQKFVSYLLRAQLVNCYILGTGFAFAAGLASPLVALIFGSQWFAVTPIFAILAIGGIFRGLTQVMYWIFLACDQTGAQFRLYLYTRPVMVGLILAGLPWGPVGVAVGHSIAFMLYWLVSLWRAGKAAAVDITPLFRQAVRSLTVISAPVGILAFLGTRCVHNLAVGGAIGSIFGLAYIAIVCLVSSTERQEFAMISLTLRSAASRRAAA